MPYVTYSDYETYYGTPPVGEDDFPVYAGFASDLIDIITQYRITAAGGLAALCPALQTAVKKACCVQVLYFAQNGGVDGVVSGLTGQEFTVGKVHIGAGSTSSSAGAVTSAQKMFAPMAVALLEQTGLMQRSVPCFDPSRDSFYMIP